MKLDPEERLSQLPSTKPRLIRLTTKAQERGLNFRVMGTPKGCLTIGLASQRAGSITDQPLIIPRPAPRTRETGSPPALSRSEALVRETREPRVRIRLPPGESLPNTIGTLQRLQLAAAVLVHY
jgi:hypothetical protein